MRKKLCIFIIFLIIAMAIVIGFIIKYKYFLPQSNKVSTEITVNIKLVKPTQFKQVISAYGKIIAPKSSVLRAQSDGVIEAILFKEGQRVKKGDILFQIKRSDVSIPLKTLRANLDIAYQRYIRAKKFSQEFKGGISEIDLLAAKSKYEQTQAQYNEAISIQNVSAPVSGVVEKTDLAVGDMVLSGDLLTVVSSNQHLQIEYQLPLSQAQYLKLGQPVKFKAENLTVKGIVSYISPEASAKANLITLRADIIQNDHLSVVMANAFGQVEQQINLDKTVIFIDQNIIQTDSSGFYVFLYHNGYAIKQAVTVGELNKHGEIEVTSGLKVNDQLIVDHLDTLSDGKKVKVKAL
ncbi:efflux RND transporter periplasmic adaptor subunit [Thiotrichales bacterium 19X7-9]|nr:efflux RND transporter periplasmic adaptor subunit [Thiotrichales bacterium 19X7-9]